MDTRQDGSIDLLDLEAMAIQEYERADLSETLTLYCGDCLEVMPTLEAGSVDAVVTDPPYGLDFMGKDWDHGVPAVAFWREALRVAKPGAHLLAFGGTRTHHRLMCAIEDAGWEIRDTIMWVYGSGFPKSHNIGKAIDKAAGAEREVVGVGPFASRRPTEDRGKQGITFADDSYVRPAGHDITAPATPAAQQWAGWGTALKPAWEPIVVARKPLCGTVAENVLAHGTGAINVDGCRVESGGSVAGTSPSHSTPQDGWDRPWRHDAGAQERIAAAKLEGNRKAREMGRWPANLIHDGSEEVVGLFPVTKSGKMAAGQRRNASKGGGGYHGNFPDEATAQGTYGDIGSAARFFYCAKASKADRDAGLGNIQITTAGERAGGRKEGSKGLVMDGGKANPYAGTSTPAHNHHPTVKPTNLMRYLCRLVTPSGGMVLDPFMGSGSTGRGAVLESFRFIGIEIDEGYFEIAERRISEALVQPPLFHLAPAPAPALPQGQLGLGI